MSYARQIIEDYFRRTGQPADNALDAAFMYQRSVLRDLLERLDAILADEGVPPATAAHVIRCMLYGSPSVADAELRMEQDKRMVEMAARMPPLPINPKTLGMPAERRWGQS